MEDFEPYRKLVSSLLDERPDLQVVGGVSDGLQAVETAQELQPDLILMDIGLPGINGIEAAATNPNPGSQCEDHLSDSRVVS